VLVTFHSTWWDIK